MSFRVPRARRPGALGRRARVIIPLLVAIAVLIILIAIFTSVWTQLLWYRAVGYAQVYTTIMGVKVLLFVVSGLIMAAFIALNMYLAYRTRPPFRSFSLEQQGLERYRATLEPHLRVVVIAITGVIGLITGGAMAGRWTTWELFVHRQPFGVDDPQFHMDAGFYIFTYPFLRLVMAFAFAAVVLAVVAAAATHYLYGGLRLQAREEKATTAARAHLAALIGVFVLLKAVAYWLDRYGLVYSQRGVVAGASYADVNAVLPAKTILAVIAVICAGLFFAAIARRGIMLPAAGFGLMVLSAIIVGGLYPAIIQQFQVKPNEADKEAPYIARNIKATRQAYDIADAKVIDYDAKTNAPDVLSSSSFSGARLLDPGVVAATFQQLQQIRGFYTFPDSLDIDRYDLNGKVTPAVVATRGVDGPPEGQRNWINSHVVYTHGFGFVAATARSVNRDGEPDFIESDIPPQGDLGKYQPRVYFGEHEPGYSIVGAPKGARPHELDYPNESAAGQRNNTYKGSGGVWIGSPFRRLVYALKFQDKNVLLSGAVSDDSRIMYVRDPRQRVARVAPFLELDGNPYPAVVNGRIVWIVDGYTTTPNYPYSESTALGQATRDTKSVGTRAVTRQPGTRVNYIRNSVKAVVDAYNGSVTLYTWNPDDPMLKAWKDVFPGVVRDESTISPELRAHLRYPEDLFKVQREMLTRYHVNQPRAFYSGQDFWKVPDDPTREGEAAQPPYYLMVKMPGQDNQRFSLTSTFVPRKRPNLAAFMAVDSTPGPDYGKIRVLQLPRNTAIPGPGQVQNQFEAEPKVKKALFSLRSKGSETVTGNLLTLPLGGGLLYVEPVFVRASGGESYPLLQQVVVAFGNEIGIAPTLDEAVAQVTGAGVVSGGGQQGGGQQGGGPPSRGAQASPQLRKALEQARDAYQDGQAALKRGDFQSYGDAQRKLKQALDKAWKIQKRESASSSGSSGSS
ncbi:MAG: UPF0182 family protein [Streptosporangiaceae bacterium]